MKVSGSTKTALAILAVVLAYFALRSLFSTDGETERASAEPELFTVVAQPIEPAEWRDEVVVRGRTDALRKIVVRAETSGAVAETPAEPGRFVEEGAVLCRLNVDARRSALDEARASLAKAELDYKAAVELAKDGFRSETAVAAAKAQRDLAAASVERAQVDLARTAITAPFDGVFDERLAETGDFLSVGDPCGRVIAFEPFLAIGAVGEKDVSKLAPGDRGVARLATGEIVEGEVRLVAQSADPQTRTFAVELEIPNPEGKLRDGVTAEFTVFASRRNAHLAPRSALTLDDDGALGVRLLDEEDVVRFERVAILGETADGVWLSGLDGVVRLITRGQEYVKRGQKVRVAEPERPA